MLAAFESTYRHDHKHEHALLLDHSGNPVVERVGDIDSVQFSPQELDRACMGLLTHNHPHGKPFSKDDLTLAAEYGMTIRAVGDTPDGEQYDYTVKMPAPSKPLADAIGRAFDGTVQQTTRSLANRSYNAWKLEREARHTAISALAKRYGFLYQRVQRNAPVSETTRHERARLDTFAALEKTMRADVFLPLHAALTSILARNADSLGTIPMQRLEYVRHAASRLVMRTVLGSPLQDGTLAPYTHRDGQVVPRSPYFKALYGAMYGAASAAVERHAAMLRKYLPEDLRRAFEFASVNPFERDLAETDDAPQYDPLHLWIGDDGKQLSDRIWVAAGDMRRKLDAYLTEAIAARRSVAQMTKELEDFLMPGNGVYEAMRLARTEVASAYARADSAAAQQNPLVETYQPFTAPEHACCDGCDDIVAAGPYPKDDITHLPPYHPFCICGVLWNMVQNVATLVDMLRQKIADAISAGRTALSDIIGPLSRKFTDLLFRGKA